MIILRLLFLPLRLLYFLWCGFRNSFKGGDTIIHRVPDRFTLVRPAGWLAYFIPRQEAHYIEYLAGLKIMAESPRLKTVALILPEMQAPYVEVEEIARRIDALRAAGKEVVAFAEGGNLKTLMLMAAADRRYVALNSDYQITFPSAEPFFVKDTLARLGVRVDSHAAGKFKSAAEMFTRSSFSPPARRAIQELLGGLRDQLEDRLKKTPGLPGTAKNGFIRTLKNNSVLEASELVRSKFAAEELEASRFGEKALGFPAGQAPPHPFEREADRERRESAAKADEEERKESKKLSRKERRQERKRKKRLQPRLTSEGAVFNRYRRKHFRLFRLRRVASLAFVHLEGSITMGRPQDQPHSTSIDAQAFRDVFKQLETSPEEAVFLYINSPGGSASASEILYQSISDLARMKPVFALLGPVAASGGFYIASAAHKVFAAGSTITGSIGVVTIRPNLKGLYHKLGVKKERIAFDRTRDLLSEAGPLSPASLQLLKKHIRSSYDLFLSRVAAGRGLDRKTVESAAEGRVWTGQEFARRGLVDGAFDLFDALDYYKKTVGYGREKDFRLNFYPDAKADLRRVLEERMPAIPGLARLGGRSGGSKFAGAGVGSPRGAAGAAAFAVESYLNGELASLAGPSLLYYLPARLLLRGII